MDDVRKIYVQTELKFSLDITSEGFSMDSDDFKVVIRSTKGRMEIGKSEMILTEDGEYLFTVDTSVLGTGDYYAYIIAYVPDEDFDDGLRTEVTKQLLCTVMP